MSKSAPSKRTTRAAQLALPRAWQLTISTDRPLNGPELFIDASMPGPGQTTVIRGNMNDSSRTPFEGFYNSEGFIEYSYTIGPTAYNFYGVISPSGQNMSGYVTILGDGHADEDASWSAQARGGGDDDDRPHRKPAAKKGHK